MESESDGVEPEQISDAFVCCVCLDLLYKPIVLACGHVACFWCVHRSMSSLHESHCPICRRPYQHFPTICQMLHFLLLKIYPITYKSRENQILEDEKKMDCFSPHFECASLPDEELNSLGDLGQSSATISCANLSSDPCSTSKVDASANVTQLNFVPFFQETGRTNPKEIPAEGVKVISTLVIEEKVCQPSSNETCGRVSISDVLCAACKQLLFRPVVLNCGHVYCETCIINPADERLRCQVCQSPHPRGFPKVFLELDHFLNEEFPTEYALRRETTQLKQVDLLHENRNPSSTESGENDIHFLFPAVKNILSWFAEHGSKIHFGAGCDSCGMYPIFGDRYRCEDCTERIGFDLCGDCYNTRSKLPGRFNQQHTPEHRFQIVPSHSVHRRMLRALRGQVEDGSVTPIPSNDDLENPENAFPMSIDSPENSEDGLALPVTPTDTVEDQSQNQSPT